MENVREEKKGERKRKRERERKERKRKKREKRRDGFLQGLTPMRRRSCFVFFLRERKR